MDILNQATELRWETGYGWGHMEKCLVRKWEECVHWWACKIGWTNWRGVRKGKGKKASTEGRHWNTQWVGHAITSYSYSFLLCFLHPCSFLFFGHYGGTFSAQQGWYKKTELQKPSESLSKIFLSEDLKVHPHWLACGPYCRLCSICLFPQQQNETGCTCQSLSPLCPTRQSARVLSLSQHFQYWSFNDHSCLLLVTPDSLPRLSRLLLTVTMFPVSS